MTIVYESLGPFLRALGKLQIATTAPTFASLVTIVTGWILSGRGTITRMILTAGPSATKHFFSYQRVFSTARWSIDAIGLAVFEMAKPLLGDIVMLGLDDTLARKRGLKIFGTGMHHDPLSSTRSDATAEQVVTWYAMRWSVEEPHGWIKSSVERTAPLGMLLHSLVVLWFVAEGFRHWRPLDCPWYASKSDPSFAAMLATLRRLSVRMEVSRMALRGRGARKLAALLENAVAMAA